MKSETPRNTDSSHSRDVRMNSVDLLPIQGKIMKMPYRNNTKYDQQTNAVLIELNDILGISTVKDVSDENIMEESLINQALPQPTGSFFKTQNTF